jgi:hypothetical protein
MRMTYALHSLSVAAVLSAATLAAQEPTRWIVEPRASLAWWQIDPHIGHLWATTCPDDPSWQPGEGHSPSYYINWSERKRVALTDTRDDRIPLYPRGTVRLLCREAVQGVILVADPGGWDGVSGTVSILADSLVTGLDLRDRFARNRVFETAKFPSLRFTIHNVQDLQPGDTLRGVATGSFEFRGVAAPMTAPVKAWMEGELLRVVAEFEFPARDLTKVYDVPEMALGMGVGMRVWRTVYAGVDLMLKQVPATESASSAGNGP